MTGGRDLLIDISVAACNISGGVVGNCYSNLA